MDTSTAVLCVAVMDGGKVLAERNILAQRGHAELLLPAIKDALAEAGWVQQELDGIIVGVGPGSYTGIRIAVTAGKSLAWTLGIPVAGVSSLEIMALGAWAQGAGLTAADLAPALAAETEAAGAASGAGSSAGRADSSRVVSGENSRDVSDADSEVVSDADSSKVVSGENDEAVSSKVVGSENNEAVSSRVVSSENNGAVSSGGVSGADSKGVSSTGEWVVPLMDARRGQVYTALFEVAPGRLTRRLEPDAIRLMETWVEELGALWTALPEDARPSLVTLAGDTAKHAAAAEKLRPLLGERLRITEYAPEGGYAGLLGAARLLRGERDDSHGLQPNYTQLAEAEANKLRMP